MAVAGTFIKTRFDQILLSAVSMDAQEELVILGWPVVPNECEETWDWFLTSLGKAHPGINERGSVVVNDSEKGLINSVAKSLPNAHNAFCCYHIAANVQTKQGIVIKRYVLSESSCWGMMESHH